MSASGPRLSPPVQGNGGGTGGETHDAGLSGQIDALLAGMQESAATLAADQTSQQVEAQLAGTEETAERHLEPGDDPPLNPGEVESLASQIDALVSEVGAAAATGSSSHDQAPPTSAAVGPEVTLPASTPDERGGATADGAPLGQRAPAGAEPNAVVDLHALDERLAAQVREPDPPVHVAAPPVAAVLPDLAAAAARRDEELAAEAAVAQALAESAALATDPVGVPSEEPGRSRGGPISSVGRALLNAVRTAGGFSLLMSARTLEASPKLARDTIGWIGLVTVFFACCMWAIILFFRSTPVPEVYGVASDVLEPGEPTPQGRPRPQAHKEEAAHGEADAHEAEADSHGGGGHGAPANDGHGGGHH